MVEVQEIGIFRTYEDRRFNAEGEDWLRKAGALLANYERAGYSVTLRTIHYQFVSRGFYANTARNYNRLGDLLSAGRRAGRISWTSIEDVERPVHGTETFENPRAIIEAAREQFKIDLWRLQRFRPEVWIEKNALLGIVEPVCRRERVNYFACKGYASDSAVWRAGRRFLATIAKGQVPVVLHLGDHDPSGIDMTRDVTDRLALFVGMPIQVVRLALNMDQIEHHQPPENFVKLADSRAPGYVEKFGDHCWELDALSPDILASTISGAVARLRDDKAWDEAQAIEADMLDHLDEIVEGCGREVAP